MTEETATLLIKQMAEGLLRPSDLMEKTLDRIDAVNPSINAIVALRDREELMAEAKALDDLRKSGPLHGLPIAVKDLQNTKGIRTTYGSPLYRNHVPAEDDLLPARLKAAGAIIIGKTNTPEFGFGSQTFNPVYGATRNPFDHSRTPGGSSGGAAAALATGMLQVADGSDMMGSLRNPAAWCGVWSLRPTVGLIPDPVASDPLLHRLSTDGPMARHPIDLKLLLDVIAQNHPLWPIRPERLASKKDSLAGVRLGWLRDWGGAFPFENGILSCSESALAKMETAGASVNVVETLFPEPEMWKAWENLRAWLTANRHRAEYDDPERRRKLKAPVLWEIELGLSLTADDIFNSSQIRAALTQFLLSQFQRFDALVLPATQVWPFSVDVEYPTEIEGINMPTYHRWMEVMIPASLAGLPAVGVPAGFNGDGLPVGLQMIGPPGSDDQLLALASAWETSAGNFISPPKNLQEH